MNGEKVERVVAIGTFDGVHLGHRMLLSALRSFAESEGLRPAVITFDRHPLCVVAPERAPGRLTSVDEETALLRAEGVEAIVVPFTESTRKLTAAQWLDRIRREYGVRAIMLGYDNTFGSDGRGMSPEDYVRMAGEVGLVGKVAPQLPGVSSSEVRRLVRTGRVESAAKLLGRPYAVDGVVEGGKKLGRRLGFPTANMAVAPDRLLPAEGVYRAYAVLPDGARRKAMVNIGRRPTVEADGRPTVEVYILDWTGSLYGDRLRVEFVDRLRDERKFDSLEELRQALAEDAAAAAALPDSGMRAE